MLIETYSFEIRHISSMWCITSTFERNVSIEECFCSRNLFRILLIEYCLYCLSFWYLRSYTERWLQTKERYTVRLSSSFFFILPFSDCSFERRILCIIKTIEKLLGMPCNSDS